MREPKNRRDFLTSSLIVSGSLSIAAAPMGLLSACKSTGSSELMNNNNGPTPGPNPNPDPGPGPNPGALRIRGSVFDPANGENVDAYRRAFAKLRSSQAWRTFASIHDGYCPHGNWFFLPWHRVYIYHFEQAIAKISGKADFALPYWDWDGPDRNQLPDLAKTQTGGLYWQRRQLASQRIDPNFVGEVAMKRIMDANDFIAFGSGRARRIRDASSHGLLEGMPHNRTHVWVGGDMGTMMSPLDPIFWMHHCNVDRVWAEWQHKQRAANLPEVPPEGTGSQPRTSAWLNTSLRDGFQEMDNVQTLTTKAVTRGFRISETLKMEETFGYTYDKLAPADTGSPMARAMMPQPVTYSVTMDLPIKRVFTLEASKALVFALDMGGARASDSAGTPVSGVDLVNRYRERGGATGGQIQSFHMRVTNVPVPTNPAETQLMFYLNKNYNPSTRQLDLQDQNFVGSHAFFGHDHAHHGTSNPLNITFDLLDALKNQSADISNSTIYVIVKVISPNDFPAGLKQKLQQMKVQLEYTE